MHLFLRAVTALSKSKIALTFVFLWILGEAFSKYLLTVAGAVIIGRKWKKGRFESGKKLQKSVKWFDFYGRFEYNNINKIPNGACEEVI